MRHKFADYLLTILAVIVPVTLLIGKYKTLVHMGKTAEFTTHPLLKKD